MLSIDTKISDLGWPSTATLQSIARYFSIVELHQANLNKDKPTVLVAKKCYPWILVVFWYKVYLDIHEGSLEMTVNALKMAIFTVAYR